MLQIDVNAGFTASQIEQKYRTVRNVHKNAHRSPVFSWLILEARWYSAQFKYYITKEPFFCHTNYSALISGPPERSAFCVLKVEGRRECKISLRSNQLLWLFLHRVFANASVPLRVCPQARWSSTSTRGSTISTSSTDSS